MRRLIKREKGAVATLLAVLLGSGALLAVIALAVDFGRVYLEQQTLRNASSAASLALANACAQDLSPCASQSAAELFVQDFLNANSADGDSVLLELCGSSPLATCVISSEKASACADYLGSDNLVRVIAGSKENGLSSIQLFFTDQDSVGLAQCSQSEWNIAGGGGQTLETIFDLGFPICDYVANQEPVVWFQFRNQQLHPDIPREQSCELEIGSESFSFVDVSNGVAGIDIPIGQCDQTAFLTLGQIVQLGETNLQKLCDDEIENFLDSVIANEQALTVGLIGAFVRYAPGNYDFEIAGKAAVRILGYRLTNNKTGGVEPPGGWDQYPVGFPANQSCKASRPCFYGYYVSEPEFVNGQVLARLVYE
ncbi:MAG: hypothetical protein K9G13_06750 [Aquiluna sp.]|nr:hypothetical protein [Aquiluna sp.]MCF8546216.1 hypothetical protein [Aquiluna sp.]